jgi:hypothetical protein
MSKIGLVEDFKYGPTMDALRTKFATTQSEDCVTEMYRHFSTGLEACAEEVRKTLGIDVCSIDQIGSIHRRDAFPIPGVRREQLETRYDAVVDYLRALAGSNFWYGALFPTDAYPTFSISKTFRVVSMFDGLRRRLQKLRRTLAFDRKTGSSGPAEDARE